MEAKRKANRGNANPEVSGGGEHQRPTPLKKKRLNNQPADLETVAPWRRNYDKAIRAGREVES